MIRYLTLPELLELHRQVVAATGGAVGIYSLDGLESTVAQPRMTFGGQEVYPTIAEKASALAFSRVVNRVGMDWATTGVAPTTAKTQGSFRQR